MRTKSLVDGQSPSENLYATFEVESPAQMETSQGVLDSVNSTKLAVSVFVNPQTEVGSFEIYDLKTGGVRFYGEGGLWFEGKTLIDYDGVFELSDHVINQLKKWGFSIDLLITMYGKF